MLVTRHFMSVPSTVRSDLHVLVLTEAFVCICDLPTFQSSRIIYCSDINKAARDKAKARTKTLHKKALQEAKASGWKAKATGKALGFKAKAKVKNFSLKAKAMA